MVSVRILCKTQLITTVNDYLTSFDNNRQVNVTVLDFLKAFDTVPHGKLIQYGFDGPLHTWLAWLLTKRKMPVVLEGSLSEPASVDSGVLQGTAWLSSLSITFLALLALRFAYAPPVPGN